MESISFFADFKELLSAEHQKELSKYEITSLDVTIDNFGKESATSLYLDSYIYLLIREGEITISVNYETYQLNGYGIAVLTPLHILQFNNVSADMKGKLLVVNKPLLDIVPSMEKVFKHLNRSLKLYSNPVFNLQPDNFHTLDRAIQHIAHKIEQTNHLFQQEMIQNLFVAFLLEWIHIYESDMSLNPSKVNLNRSEQILKSFISLLKVHFETEHTVPFYADKLHITPQYLTLIVKKLTGQTINEFIFEMIYSKARILLNRSDLSIQQIAEELHFSDSSSFCKFFKRRSGISPLKYRMK